jgi:hypothetical protein
MEPIYFDSVTVSINKDFRHRNPEHPKGPYPDATVALTIPQSMGTQELKEFLENKELRLNRYKSESIELVDDKL